MFSVEQDGYGDETQGYENNLAISTCAIAPLLNPPFTDPVAQAFDDGQTIDIVDLTPAMQTAEAYFVGIVGPNEDTCRNARMPMLKLCSNRSHVPSQNHMEPHPLPSVSCSKQRKRRTYLGASADLKSAGPKGLWEFKSPSGHHRNQDQGCA